MGEVSGPGRRASRRTRQVERARGRAATERLLQDAALRVLDHEGVLSGISLQEVADEAGLSRGLINHYFGSRRALLRAALDRRRRAAVTPVREMLAGPPSGGFRWFWRGTIRDPQWARVMALLALDDDPSFEPIHMLDDVLAAAEQAKADGTVPADADIEAGHVVTLALACGWSLLRESFARQLGVAVEELDERAERVVLGGGGSGSGRAKRPVTSRR
jgi:AcrR family transcriptional regulator